MVPHAFVSTRHLLPPEYGSTRSRHGPPRRLGALVAAMPRTRASRRRASVCNAFDSTRFWFHPLMVCHVAHSFPLLASPFARSSVLSGFFLLHCFDRASSLFGGASSLAEGGAGAAFNLAHAAVSVPGASRAGGTLRQRRAATSKVRLPSFFRGLPECGRQPPLQPFFPTMAQRQKPLHNFKFLYRFQIEPTTHRHMTAA